MHTYAWVSDLSGVREACAGPLHRIPLIRPAEASRAERWQNILAWHGLRMAGEYTGGDSAGIASDGRDRSGDLIVSVGDDCYAVALLLATADCRPLVCASDISDIGAHGFDSWIRSVLIVARPSDLKNRALLGFCARTSVPWGILTGRDAPALNFAAVKLLAARHRLSLPSAHLDAITSRKWLWDAGGEI